MILFFLYIALSAVYFYSSKHSHQISVALLAMILACLAFYVGLGDMLGGYDRYIYGELFDRNADLIRSGGTFWNSDSPLMGYESEASYVVWNNLVAYITENRYIFILLTTVLIYTLLFVSIRNYFSNYPLALLIFMGLWFFFTFTYLRQVLAASCAWLAYKYVIDKKLWKFLIIWFISYKFHNSAIIFLPLYFLPIKKWSPQTIVILLMLCLAIGFTGAPMAWYNLYGDITDVGQRAYNYADDNSGFRFDYLLEVIVLLYFIFKRYDEIPNDRKSVVFLNAALMFCVILLLFIQSSNAGRQSWYYMMGMIYTLTYLASQRRKFDTYARNLYLLVTVLYFRIVIAWGILLSPYKTFLTDGHRKDDPIFHIYEYDVKYDRDKFYREAFKLYIPK